MRPSEINNKLKEILSPNELKNLTHGDLVNAEQKTKLVSDLSCLLIKNENIFSEIFKKLKLDKNELIKLLKKLIKNIYKHRMTNRKQFLYLKKYSLNEIESISYNARQFVKQNKIYSPINEYYKGTTLNFFYKKIKILKKNIFVDSLNNYDEIIVVGSGKGVVSTKSINGFPWQRRSLKYYTILAKIYQKAISNCARYNG